MKKVFLAPYNDLAISLSNRTAFKKNNKVLGFIDKNATVNNVYNYQNIPNTYDYIIICSPNYYRAIYSSCIAQGVSKKRIQFFIDDNINLLKSLTLARDCYKLPKYCNKYRKVLKGLKNKHINERIFLIGNGPSLKNFDLNKLNNEITFAANKIYLLYNETKWRPTYYLVEDNLVYTQNHKRIQELKNSLKLFPNFSKEWADEIEDGNYFELKYEPNSINFPQFSDDIEEGFYWGSTVIYTMMQFAAYMGAKKIYLLGVDFHFIIPEHSFINSNGGKDLICEGEVNHFHKDYRKMGEKWNLPNLEIQKKSFLRAQQYAKRHEIQIYNASTESKLDIFKKINLNDIF